MKWFYVTGCDSGFGRQLVGMLVKDGHGVFAGVFLSKSVGELSTEYEGRGKVVPVQVDVTSEDSVRAAAEFIAEYLKGSGLDGVVNNAGLLVTPGPVEWTPIEAYRRMLDVNVIGLASVTKSVLPLIRKARGRIVNVASIAGRVGLPGQPAYCASKFAVEGYSDVLRRDVAPWGVTVHIIEPGVFKQTALYGTWRQGFSKSWDNLDETTKQAYGREFFEGGLAGLDNSLKISNSDSSIVPQAMVHALTSASPKYRYRCGKDSKYIFTVLSWLHESTQDWILPASKVNEVSPATAPVNGLRDANARYDKNRTPYLLMAAAAGVALSRSML
eukprot:m.169580 g.169580  ORF g.169580 m.169580 type:complete len:329 (+) comp18246_c0_seq3:88-1074(+)